MKSATNTVSVEPCNKKNRINITAGKKQAGEFSLKKKWAELKI